MKSFVRSFVYAANGIKTAILEERNLRFHICVAVYVYIFSFFYNFGRTEYAVLTVLIVGVIALELVNSAFERSVSRPAPEQYRTAGAVKDIAAGAVLVYCIGAVVCGVFLFWDIAVFSRIIAYFTGHIPVLIILVISIIFCAWFIFGLGSFLNKRRTLEYGKKHNKSGK